MCYYINNYLTKIYFIVLILIGLTNSEELPEGKAFKPDYQYNSKTQSYLKIHTDSENWKLANRKCKGEGGHLLDHNEEDIIFAHALYKQLHVADDDVWIDNKQLGSDSEESTENDCSVMNKFGGIETADCYLDLSYICQISKSEIYYDPKCDVIARGYEYNNVTGKCYKMSRYAAPWFEAEKGCKNDNAHLLVLNSEREHDEIMNFMRRQPVYTPGSYHSYYAIIGFKVNANEKEQRIFRTIYNETLDEAGYSDWSDTEPNNFAQSEYCGSVFRNDGKLNDVNCANPYAFICETRVHNSK